MQFECYKGGRSMGECKREHGAEAIFGSRKN